MSQDLEIECAYYIDGLAGPDSENALHSLMELPQAALPILMRLYRTQETGSAKRDIVHSIWQHRDRDSLDWLVGILVKEDIEEIWQEALDGLIILRGSSELSRLEVNCPLKSQSINKAIELLEQGYA